MIILEFSVLPESGVALFKREDAVRLTDEIILPFNHCLRLCGSKKVIVKVQWLGT